MNNIPKGYKLVPVTPTKKILDELTNGNSSHDKVMRFRWAQMLAAVPAPPQPIFDEAKERELFEALQVDEGGNIDFEDGYYDNVFVQSAWDGWKACAQSRAKAGEDE